MTAFSTEVLMPAGPAEAAKLLAAALENLRGVKHVKSLDKTTIEARTGVSFRSWGEVVKATVTAVDNGSLVTVTSKSRMRTTLIDYGQNRRNVEHVVRFLNAG